MEEEIHATYGTTRELKMTLKSADGQSRTITLLNPKTDATDLKTAVQNFANLVFDTDTNIFAVNGYQPVSMAVDFVETERLKVGEYGQSETTTASPYLSQTIIEVSGDETEAHIVEVFNAEDAQLNCSLLSGDSADAEGITFTINQTAKTITFEIAPPNNSVYYKIELLGKDCVLLLLIN